MAMAVEFSDRQPTVDADIVLKINYDPMIGSAARAFEIAAQLIHSLEDMDRVLAQTIHIDLETALIVEDLEKSSLRIFLRNVLRGIPDDALKDLNVKQLIGHYLVKAKYAAIRWLDEPENSRRSITDLTEEVARIAKETDVRHLPDYPPPNPARFAQPLDKFQEVKKQLNANESLTITLDRSEYTVNLESDWLPSESLADDASEKELMNESDLFLIIGKPDFIGNAKWSFKHGKRSISLRVDDEDWLSDFRAGAYPIRPGDALRVRVRYTHKYDGKGNLLSSDETIIKVFEIIEGAGTTPDMFDE